MVDVKQFIQGEEWRRVKRKSRRGTSKFCSVNSDEKSSRRNRDVRWTKLTMKVTVQVIKAILYAYMRCSMATP